MRKSVSTGAATHSRMPRIAPLPDPEVVDPADLVRAYRAGGIDLVCVLGPTASGKTRYAVGLARRMAPEIPAEILSADSRQVYRGMDIGTGKDLDEYGGIPYHIIDVVPAGTQYNVWQFREDFLKAYADIRARGALPILCGGTGLYIQAVTTGYDFRTHKPLSEAGATHADPTEGLPRNTFFIGYLNRILGRNGNDGCSELTDRFICARKHLTINKGPCTVMDKDIIALFHRPQPVKHRIISLCAALSHAAYLGNTVLIRYLFLYI